MQVRPCKGPIPHCSTQAGGILVGTARDVRLDAGPDRLGTLHRGAIVQRPQTIEGDAPACIATTGAGHVAARVEQRRDRSPRRGSVLERRAVGMLPEKADLADVRTTGRTPQLGQQRGGGNLAQRFDQDPQVDALVLEGEQKVLNRVAGRRSHGWGNRDRIGRTNDPGDRLDRGNASRGECGQPEVPAEELVPDDRHFSTPAQDFLRIYLSRRKIFTTSQSIPSFFSLYRSARNVIPSAAAVLVLL